MNHLLLCTFLFASFSLVGCGPSRPDPRANPDFNEEALTDPGAVKMDSPGVRKRYSSVGSNPISNP